MKRAIIFFLVLLCLVCSVTAVKPTPAVLTTGGQLYIVESGITTFKYNYDHTFDFHVFNSTAGVVRNSTAECNFHMYNRSGAHIVDKHKMDVDANGEDFKYYYNSSFKLINQPGTYSYIVWCINNGTGVTKEAGFTQAQFYVTVTGEQAPDDLTPIAMLMLLPLVFGFLLIKGAFGLDPVKHSAIKIFLFLSSLLTPIASAWYAMDMLYQYYFDTLVIENVARDVWYGTVGLYLLLAYFILYWMYCNFKTDMGTDEELKL